MIVKGKVNTTNGFKDIKLLKVGDKVIDLDFISRSITSIEIIEIDNYITLKNVNLSITDDVKVYTSFGKTILKPNKEYNIYTINEMYLKDNVIFKNEKTVAYDIRVEGTKGFFCNNYYIERKS